MRSFCTRIDQSCLVVIKLLCSQFYSYQILLHLGGGGRGGGWGLRVMSLVSIPKPFMSCFSLSLLQFKPIFLSFVAISSVPVSWPCLSSGVAVIIFMYLMFCSVPRVRKLLKAGVNVNASDGATSDNKALHWAVSYGNADIVKLLCGRFIFYIFWNVLSPYLKLVLVQAGVQLFLN